MGCAIEVHRHTGPGLLEAIYGVCLAREFTAAQLPFEHQRALSVCLQGRVARLRLPN